MIWDTNRGIQIAMTSLLSLFCSMVYVGDNDMGFIGQYKGKLMMSSESSELRRSSSMENYLDCMFSGSKSEEM